MMRDVAMLVVSAVTVGLILAWWAFGVLNVPLTLLGLM